jgi:hypothetical protein
MTEDKEKLMNQYAITSEQKMVYHFKEIDRLKSFMRNENRATLKINRGNVQ